MTFGLIVDLFSLGLCLSINDVTSLVLLFLFWLVLGWLILLVSF